MSKVIRAYLDDETERRMEQIATESGRSVEALAESAIEEAALQYFKDTGKLSLPSFLHPSPHEGKPG